MYEQELELAQKAALEAGAYLMRSQAAAVERAPGKDIKLSSDRESEQILIECLSPSGIPILSEECGYVGGKDSKQIWIIDPLDGTANYWRGMRDLACVSVALWEERQPVLGVINRFHCGELYFGAVGSGAWMNGTPIHTSGVQRVREAILATGLPVQRDYGSESLSLLVRQAQSFKKVRMLGTAAVMGALVASGKIDVYREDGIMLWDIAASSAIVAAAGGCAEYTDLGHNRCICMLFSSRELQENYRELLSRREGKHAEIL